MVRLLLNLGVLRRVAGDEEAFVKATGDALYDVERRVLAALLAASRGPSTIEADGFDERLDLLSDEIPPTTDELRNQRIRHHLTRRLLDEPVLYYDELDEAERAYLTSQRTAITARISELTGLIAEVRAEGIAMVDPHDDLTDVRMPESGTDGHATLLLAEHLAAPAGNPCRSRHSTTTCATPPSSTAATGAKRLRARRRGRARQLRCPAARGVAPGPPHRWLRDSTARAGSLRTRRADHRDPNHRGEPMNRSLPEPALERWQPLRAGLIDLFYYDAEEFWFRDGRLLLRGNNGTGKSKVLALTLPFLLDGDLSPHRVEPDADPKKRMEWNLLLGGAHPYPERLGYTWIEFGRIDDQGVTAVPHPRLRAEGGGR